jgi:hypothetical protein
LLVGRQKAAQQAVAHHGGVGGADDFLAREIDGQVFLVDQDAGDVNHRGQVQQVNQHQLATHTQASQPTRNPVHQRHGASAAAVLRWQRPPCGESDKAWRL